MPSTQFSPSLIKEAEVQLDALADEGHYLRALELLRLLEKSLVRCHEKRIPVQRIWMQLTERGVIFTRQHFTRAYREFLAERGLKSQRWRTPPQRPSLPADAVPAERANRFPKSSEITRAVNDLARDVDRASSSLDLVTKNL